ncbi:Pre-mRNA splicing factor [Mycena indigotica]|uniref:Pre-mRNA splicing factor n=1 Tax=Mycena indigotica TaxID=2126181 RepID=A0A8H6WD44_9AGAR|nr:Pre-mRNA splicing factor [Mycena indigotica]KAF7312106.1 Pre-mRNA splicing factor [Mycena indigotica]
MPQRRYPKGAVEENQSCQRELWIRSLHGGTGSQWRFDHRYALCSVCLRSEEAFAEYLGQIIHDLTVDSRDPIAIHRHRNYVFQLNKTLSIDGTYAGNNSRYINHDQRKPNCEARILLVNGEHRIGIFATRSLWAKEEVLFNYGPAFFQENELPKS